MKRKIRFFIHGQWSDWFDVDTVWINDDCSKVEIKEEMTIKQLEAHFPDLYVNYLKNKKLRDI